MQTGRIRPTPRFLELLERVIAGEGGVNAADTAAGLSRGTISRWTTQKDREISPANLILLADRLGLKYGFTRRDVFEWAGYLAAETTDESQGQASQRRGAAPQAFTLVRPTGNVIPSAWIVKSIPLVRQRLHAGHTEPVDPEPLLVSVPKDGNYLAMIVTGECMEPEVSPGDIVIVDLDASPHLDDPVVVMIDGEQSLRYLASRTAEHLVFEAENVSFPDLVADPHKAQIIGVIVALQRLPKRRRRRRRAS